MKKSLSLLLILLLLLALTVPALAEETEGDSDAEISESVSDDTPSSSETAPDPAPAPEPAPDPDPAPEGNAENQGPAENPPAVLDTPDVPAGSGGLDAPAYDVTEAPNGDIIIEEHSYTRTVDIQDVSALDDLPTMRSVVVSIFGVYTPKTQSVATYYDGQLMDSSTEYVPGIAGMDMEWIAGFVIFTVLLYCLMKLLGGIVK